MLIEEIVRRLRDRHPELAAEVVAHVVRCTHERLAGITLRESIPLFVERTAAKELATAPTRRVDR